MKYRYFVGVVCLITFNCLSLYVIFQQFLRAEVDDDPRSRAITTASLLSNGAELSLFTPLNIISLDRDSSFLIIADENGKTISSTAQLDDKPLQIPTGVYEYTKQHGTHQVTWAPNKNIRQATTITPFYNNTTQQHGFVAAGTGLAETENLTHQIGKLIVLSFIGLLTLAGIFFYPYKKHHSPLNS